MGLDRNISRYETTAVYSHPDAKVDIVLVHGLNGNPEKTWTASNGTFWPTDLLPDSLKGVQANILVYGYNADVYSRKNDRSASDNFIHQHAQTLVTGLTLYRKSEGTFRNPIIWVCHSLGGILVKRALLYSNDLRMTHHQDYRSIYVSTFGLIFLGTPHVGSDAATWGLMLQGMADAIMPRKFFESESVLLKTLKKDNETLANINNHFLDIYQRFRIHMVHENHKTDIKGTKITIVDANSASPQLPGVTYYGVEATHSQMCKFASKNAPGFRAVSTDIRQWVQDAPALINVRWEVEEQDKATRMRHEIHERMSPFMSPSSPYVTPSSPFVSPSSPLASPSSPRRESDLSNISSLSLSDGSNLSSLSLSSSTVPRTFLTAPPRQDAVPPKVPTLIVLDEMGAVAEQFYKLRK
ncbi:LipA and NB-ARC domain protein [Metarhizium acridum CQMa 102]|uniref:LipA and NB-ARC domain protein n=1 Tax=Metarhizium acridum (strain CQMa 102) TaxID=655827 RepID=E9EC32_METAQ|nr:LipA and NB-ARC domain protein [Metarhizium acridum CQMa 102]EFY86498.1 LipA and NB-ARC domain protein [Metarhizium acridum CQMa 102]